MRPFFRNAALVGVLLIMSGCSSSNDKSVEKYNKPWAGPAKWERERTLTPSDINKAFGNKGEKVTRLN